MKAETECVNVAAVVGEAVLVVSVLISLSIREQMEKARKETEEKMAAVLTDAQKKKLEELKGAKFEFPERGFGGPGGGQGPGGGRPGRPRNDN